MYCPKCGAQNDDNAWKCVQCGNILQQDTQTPPTHIPNYLVQSILCTLFCCLPFGIIAIVYAAQVNGKLEKGDIAGAQNASKNAKTWCWVSFGVGLVLVVFGMIAAIAVPNFLMAIQRSKRSRTAADMRAIGTALGSFQVDQNTFPVQAQETDWNDDILPSEYYMGATKDGWGTPFRYWSDGTTYKLMSYGKDLQEGGVGFDADIVYSDGQFIAPDELRMR